MGMDAEKVLLELKRRFEAPLPEFYQRHILFWHDEDQEFIDIIDDLKLDNVKIVTLTHANAFVVKKLLAMDDLESHYLVYCPVSYRNDEEHWLLNIEMYSESFRADIYTIWLEEIGLPVEESLRFTLKKYHKFFNIKEKRSLLLPFIKQIQNPQTLVLAIMASLCNAKTFKPLEIMRLVLQAGLDITQNATYQNLVTYGLDDLFWQMVMQTTGYSSSTPTLTALGAHLLLMAAARTLPEACVKGLAVDFCTSNIPYCYDLVSDWLMSKDDAPLKALAEYVEQEKNLYAHLQMLLDGSVHEVSEWMYQVMETECFPCIHAFLIEKMLMDICMDQIHPEWIHKIVDRRRASVWADDYACYYDALKQIAIMQAFYHDHVDAFHEIDACLAWRKYTQDYYRMDTAYRLFHKAFRQSLKCMHKRFGDAMKQAAEWVENLYVHWFLVRLWECWHNACAKPLAQTGRIPNVRYQGYFYDHKVAQTGSRVFVIISSGLRYEVAATLTERIRRDHQCEVELSSMCGICPTTPPYGMAALLPHRNLRAVEDQQGLTILADEMPTDAAHRINVLKARKPNTIVLRYQDLIGMKRKERSALVKGQDVIYIYHDKIDNISHTSEKDIFWACDEAMDEINHLLRIITHEWNGTRIYVTSDHGFLYTDQPLMEDAKIDQSTWKDKILDDKRRYAFAHKDTTHDHLMPICFSDGKIDDLALTLRKTTRLKLSGDGSNYVYGGTCPQEMVIPLIEFHYLRSDSKTYLKNKDKIDTHPVTLQCITQTHKISNLIFTLKFFQKERVGGNYIETKYKLYFVDVTGNIVSDQRYIIANKTDESAPKRVYDICFHLKSIQFDKTAIYELMIIDESGQQPPMRETFQIDIAFSCDDFCFFPAFKLP